ncbi:hypothetical protein CH373_07220 [Leptospira perolatii]|uniref:Glycosyltransferase RgtA/B/C/D-like domain-containing protein n=1 Tax=Leptospira perolatii TaxID=2023191 RepID=A0A2M9ZPJ7_9LEPT|nr:hypothetical protein [Leptospira perolatii]PJZ70712.1 hypothetical protein CH360_04080 [Leptospira perolatii]PJZ73921.1 hypothetical protein CH373_07220 [Leptospira perolatii]
MDLERNRKANPIFITASLIFLTALLSFLYQWHGEPSTENGVRVLAELRSLLEDGKFFSPNEPLSFLLLLGWKSVFGLNYVPAALSFGAFFLSLAIHLCAYLMQRETWKLNHYLVCYLTAINPLVYPIAIQFMPELVSLCFLLILFISFRMETVLDILVLVACTAFGFLSHFTFFWIGFTIFVIKAGTVGIREKKKQQSVFFKRRNIPKLFLVAYLSFFVFSIVLFTGLDFYGENSLHYLAYQLWLYLISFGSLIAILGVSTFLLKSEKELSTIAASVVLFLLIVVSGYFTVRPLSEIDANRSSSLSKDILSLRGRGVINPDEKVYIPAPTAAYLYFKTKQKFSFRAPKTIKDKDYLLLEDVWPVDKKILLKNVKGRNTPYLFLSEERILSSGALLKQIEVDPSLKSFNPKVAITMGKLETDKPYDKLRIFLIQLIASSKNPQA